MYIYIYIYIRKYIQRTNCQQGNPIIYLNNNALYSIQCIPYTIQYTIA